ncbi:hypothetical protein H5T89_03255 [bacterium]|nr:hypothetical protein [bacterium]
MLLELLKLFKKHIKLLNTQNSTPNTIHVKLKEVKGVLTFCDIVVGK